MISTPRASNKWQKKKFILLIIFCCVLGVGLAWELGHIGFTPKFFPSTLKSPIPSGVTARNESLVQDIKDTLVRAGIPFDEVYEASESAYIIKQKDSREIFLTSKKDIKLQVATLQFILSRLTIEGKGFSRLDLRFDKPVVVLQ